MLSNYAEIESNGTVKMLSSAIFIWRAVKRVRTERTGQIIMNSGKAITLDDIFDLSPPAAITVHGLKPLGSFSFRLFRSFALAMLLRSCFCVIITTSCARPAAVERHLWK